MGMYGRSRPGIPAPGHRLRAYQCSDSSPLLVCLRCKAYTCLGEILKLRDVCDPRRTDNNALDRFKRIGKGRHPTLKHVFVDALPPEFMYDEGPLEAPAPCNDEDAEPTQQLRRVVLALREEEDGQPLAPIAGPDNVGDSSD